ncbi:probable two-component response regulator [plant metagenome]|uniref:Probable two-component response regulator n=1 Tax=plant metagenome TaxID=1297885 RepID=A0A484PTV9_9ZZZZ
MQPHFSEDLLRIGLLEDDDDFREELALGLGGFGFHVSFSCADSASFLGQFEVEPCDVVLLDANVPGEDGFTVATRLRAHHPVGIVMLTGRGALEDRVRGLEGGADIYMTKPVDMLELSSVIRSLARRMRMAGVVRQPSSPTPARAVPLPSWSLQDGGWILTAPDGTTLHLSAQERIFIGALLKSAGTVVSRQTLSEIFNPGDPNDFELRRIDVLVSRLRAKAQSVGMKVPVLSVRGQGYVFAT